MAEEYDVGARITMDATQARATVRRLDADLAGLGSRIRGTQSMFGGLASRLLAFGSAYVGFRLITGSLERMARGAYQLNAELTQTSIGLSSVFSAVEGLSFAQAQKLAGSVYTQLTEDAIESVATTKELFDIYSGIVGPIRAAGFELEKVRDMTKDTVNAASALGVDFPQARRDVSAMARGAAGMDVKLFQVLRSMNLIKEDAQAFNALTQKSRIEKIAEALKKAGVGGAAFGRSLPGRVSTLVDIIQQFGKAFSGPIFDTFAARLGQINDYLLKNKNGIMAYLDTVGTKVSLVLEVAFERGARAAKFVADHWDEIVTKAGQVVDKMREVAPQLAKAYLGLAVGREVVGRSLEAASLAASLGVRFGGTGAAVAETAAAAAGGAWDRATTGFPAGIAELPFAASFGMASEGGMAGLIASQGGATAGAGAAGIGGATAGLVALGAVAAAVGSVFLAVSDQWVFAKQVLMEFRRPLEHLWESLQKLGESLWKVYRPIFRLVGGTLFVVLVGALEATALWMDMVATAAGTVVGWFEEIYGWLDAMIDIGFQDTLREMHRDLKALHDFVYGPEKKKNLEYSGDVRDRGPRYAVGNVMPAETFGGKAPTKRPQQYFDFRGSKFSIKQDFKDNDPDRILRIFTDGLVKQADRRLQSPFRPAFSR